MNSGGTLPSGIVAGRDYYIRQVNYLGIKYLYLFGNLSDALNQSAPYWNGSVLVDVTAAGTGSTTIIAQDPVFTKLAHQVLTSGNGYYGIYSSATGTLKSWATLLARVVEAPSVSFINGGGSTGHEILSGDTVYQTSDNSPGGPLRGVYLVARSPIYRENWESDRRWSSGLARGVLLLEVIADNSYSNPVTYPFTAGSTIFVGDYPSGTEAGTVGVPGGYTDTVFRARDNWIMAYVADQTGKSPSDSNAFNNYRGPVLRESALWPPDNAVDTVPANDYFTLIQFSDYVNNTYCTSFGTKYNTGTGGDVLRFTSPDGAKFYSPATGNIFPANRAEVGIHAFGLSQENATYYDDFAIQFGPINGITRQGFLLPIQQ